MEKTDICMLAGMIFLLPGVIAAGEPAEQGEEVTGITVTETREHGRFLADEQGRALYILKEDREGESRCQDECTNVWPPLLTVDGEPAAASSEVKDELLDTLKREDGFSQASYNGKPLYYYVKDKGAGQASGHHVTDAWGEWYLVTPEGEPLHGEDEEERTGG